MRPCIPVAAAFASATGAWLDTIEPGDPGGWAKPMKIRRGNG